MMEVDILKELETIRKYTQLGVKEVWSVDDLCLYTGLSQSRIHCLCSQHKIPHYKNGKLYFLREEIIDWMTSKDKRVATEEEMQAKAVFYCRQKRSYKLDHAREKFGMAAEKL